jgi:hypothetical protein
MIDTQLLHDVILVLAVLVAMTVALSAMMLIAPSAGRPRRPRRPPHGGIWRGLRPEPQPQPDLEDTRELVLH